MKAQGERERWGCEDLAPQTTVQDQRCTRALAQGQVGLTGSHPCPPKRASWPGADPLGGAPVYEGVFPYSTLSVFKTVLPFFHTILYLFFVAVNCAV